MFHLRAILALILAPTVLGASDRGCSCIANQEHAPGDTVEYYRRLYEEGFARVMAAVPDSSRTSPYWPLWALGRFKQARVGWASLQGNAYIALQKSGRSGGWLAIVPPSHEMLRAMPGTFAMDPNPSLRVARIRPDDVTEVWAGIFLVHVVSQLSEFITGQQAASPTRRQALMAEFRGAELELIAADLLSGGAIRSALDTVLARFSPQALDALAERDVALVASNKSFLYSALSAPQPRSEAEDALRAGFFAIALLIRYAELKGLPPEAILESIDYVVRKTSR